MNQTKREIIEHIQTDLGQINNHMKELYLKLNTLAQQVEDEQSLPKGLGEAETQRVCSLLESAMFSVQEARESVDFSSQCLKNTVMQ